MNIYILKIRTQPNQSLKWLTPGIRHQIKCLWTLRRKLKLYPTEYTTAHLKTVEDNLQKSIKLAKANFESLFINNFAFNNDSKIYQYVRSLSKSASTPSTIFFQSNTAIMDMDKANLFNQFFFSIFTQSSCSLPNYNELPSTSSPLSAIQIYQEDVYI